MPNKRTSRLYRPYTNDEIDMSIFEYYYELQQKQDEKDKMDQDEKDNKKEPKKIMMRRAYIREKNEQLLSFLINLFLLALVVVWMIKSI
jgi:hypothetical protein